MENVPKPSSPQRDQHTLAAAVELRLLIVGGPYEGRSIPLRESLVIGRSTEATARVEDDDVSRLHARFFPDANGVWCIEDLGSRNGTWLNGSRIERASIGAGDVIRLGGVSFKVIEDDPLEQELRERQRLELVGRLCLGVVHDFNNVLAAALANIDYLRGLSKTERSGSEADECLEDACNSLQRAGELGSRLLRAAKGEEGAGSTVELSKVCEEAVSLLRRVIPRAIEMRVEVQPRLRVQGFAISLQQVLINLCLNARDAMPSGGTLHIRLTREEPAPASPGETARIVLSVSDTGTGMDEATKLRVFEPFFTTKREGRGFGLGLATAAEIVAQHAGQISVQSQLGAGTTFTIHMPSQPQRPTLTAKTSPGPSEQPTLAGTVVLVVDDQQAVRRGFCRVLEQAGFVVAEVASGQAALRALQARDRAYAVALVDFDMPGWNGVETCRALRLAAPNLPTLLISGGAVDEREELHRIAVTAFLPKPITGQALVEAVRKAVRGSSGHSPRRAQRALTPIAMRKPSAPGFAPPSGPEHREELLAAGPRAPRSGS